jgi:Tfp pilus assembly protein PilO
MAMAAPSGSKQSRFLGIDAAGIGVCLLTSLVGYMMLVGPLLQKRSAAADLTREMEAQEEKAVQSRSGLQATQDRLAAARQQLAAGAVQLESASHVNKRIAGVTGFLSSCALHVDDVQTGRVAGGLQYDLVPITIMGRGTHQQCARFLQGLCAEYPDMSVMRIELAGNPAVQADAAKFRLELFWYTAPSGPGKKTAQENARSPSVL